jgi:hypothetical protein
MHLQIEEIQDLVFEKVELVEGDVIDFQTMKNDLLKKIEEE